MSGRAYLWLPVCAAVIIAWMWGYAAMNPPQRITLQATTSAAGITLTVPTGTVGPAQELVIEYGGMYRAICYSTPCRVTIPATATGTAIAKIIATNDAAVYYRSSPLDLANVGGAG